MSRDLQNLAVLQDYYAEHRVFPSFGTIADLLGYKSKRSVSLLIATLKLQGYVETTPQGRLKPGKRFFERYMAESTVRAGLPSQAFSDNHDTLTIDEYLIERPSQTVLISVKGDSMADAGIVEGDIVIVERRQLANVGDIVVAIVDNEFTLKTLAREMNEFILRPANKAYPVIRPGGDLEIFGVVVGLARKYK